VGIVTDPTNSVEVLNMEFRHQGCVLGLTSRSRDGLETLVRLVSVSSRPKCPTSWSRSRTCVSRISSRSRPKTFRVSWTVSDHFVSSRSCRRAQLNYSSPMKTSRPMPYSVGRVLGTVCLDEYCLINNTMHSDQ